MFSRIDKSIFNEKVEWIYGDLTLDNFGLTMNDLSALKNSVNVIFHVAATIRFNEPLATALKINFRSTKILLDIALECKYLEVTQFHKNNCRSISLYTVLVIRVCFYNLFQFCQ